MWFFSPPAISPPAAGTNFSRCAFALRGYERRSTLVKWYFAAEDALPLPFPTIYAGSDFYQPWEADQIEYGESVFHRQRKFYSGTPPAGAAGQTYCGTEEDFQVPKPWDPNLPSEAVGTSGLPICCNAFLGGAIVLTSPAFPFQNLIIGRAIAPQATAAGLVTVNNSFTGAVTAGAATAVGYLTTNTSFFGNLIAPAATAAGLVAVNDSFTGALTAATATAAGLVAVNDSFTGALTAATATAAGLVAVNDSFTGALTAATATAAGLVTVNDSFTGALTAATATAAGLVTVNDSFTGALTAATATAAGLVTVNDSFTGALTAATATAAGLVAVNDSFTGALTAATATAAGLVTATGSIPYICTTCNPSTSHPMSATLSTGGSASLPYDSKSAAWGGVGTTIGAYQTYTQCVGGSPHTQLLARLYTGATGQNGTLISASCALKTATYSFPLFSLTMTVTWS